MSGYMYITRRSNLCSVASYNYYPTVSFNSSTTSAVVITTSAKPVTTTLALITTPKATATTTTTISAVVPTTSAKPITTTLAPVTTTTSTTTVSPPTTCQNGSDYYLQPNTSCQKYYYCSDSIGTNNMSYICGSGYIIDQVNQYCIPNTSNYVTSSGICINGTIILDV